MKLQALVCILLWRCAIEAVAINYQVEDDEIMDSAGGKDQKRGLILTICLKCLCHKKFKCVSGKKTEI